MKRSSQEKVQVKKESGSFSESIVRYFNAKTVSCYRLTVFLYQKVPKSAIPPSITQGESPTAKAVDH